MLVFSRTLVLIGIVGSLLETNAAETLLRRRVTASETRSSLARSLAFRHRALAEDGSVPKNEANNNNSNTNNKSVGTNLGQSVGSVNVAKPATKNEVPAAAPPDETPKEEGVPLETQEEQQEAEGEEVQREPEPLMDVIEQEKDDDVKGDDDNAVWDELPEGLGGDDETNEQEKPNKDSPKESGDDSEKTQGIDKPQQQEPEGEPSSTSAIKKEDGVDEGLKEYDAEEELEEEERMVREYGSMLGALAVVLLICTAWQMSENPDGIYAGLCRLIITIFGLIIGVILSPFRKLIPGHRRHTYGHIPAALDYSYRDPALELS